MQREIKTGICAICGEFKELSFEHVPPKSAFNNKPIHMLNLDRMYQENIEYSKESLSQKGLGSYTLCNSCNNNTGGWYGDAFKEFVHQGMEILSTSEEITVVKGLYKIKPLNVFKQIITMFLSADKSGYLRSSYPLGEFILNRTSTVFPDDLRVYIYSNASPLKRFFGYCVNSSELGIQKWSEINFQPFGYFLTEKSQPPNNFMVDISSWSKLNYDEVKGVNMSTAYLKVSSGIIGVYDF